GKREPWPRLHPQAKNDWHPCGPLAGHPVPIRLMERAGRAACALGQYTQSWRKGNMSNPETQSAEATRPPQQGLMQMHVGRAMRCYSSKTWYCRCVGTVAAAGKQYVGACCRR